MQLRILTLLPDYFWEMSRDEVIKSIISGTVRTPVLGQFSLVHEDSESFFLIRDRLGLNKLFYHIDHKARVVTVGHYLRDVVQETGDYNSVKSIPAGHFLKIDKEKLSGALICYWDFSRLQANPDFELGEFQQRADKSLTALFQRIDEQFRGRRVFVCLSGGLDSSLIASYANRHLSNVTAVTFSYERLSDDYLAGEKFAAQIGMDFLPVVIEREMDETTLRQVVVTGQDWRDFNVHCAWVNYQIAKHLAETVNGEDAVVLTGDLMNEYVCDYTSVDYAGSTYYALPRIPQEKLRRFLVYGLDSGDRELGVFFDFGFTVIQPYSILAEEYLSVPAAMLAESNFKDQLNLPLLEGLGVKFYEPKNKTRAQVGSSDGGTLGLFHDSGISQKDIESVWASTFLSMTKDSVLEPLIRSGRYRS